ncbi:SPA2L protein, partial [Upupa epops]|nr:SPA2L protein [Upupa epops]
QQEYQCCLEREFCRGRAGACSDPSMGEQLRQRLRQEPAVLEALQEDGPAMVARGLQGHQDLGLALLGLAGAFQQLEMAAVNLYLFPWRKEFCTVQTFSGAYVHLLRPALPEEDLLRSFGRLGYERCDQHCLSVSQRLPGPELVAAACGFFACRLECEILAEVLLRLQPHRPCAEELLEARRLAGDVEACVEMLKKLRMQCEAATDCSDDVDLYQGEMLDSPEDMGGKDTAPGKDPSSLWGSEGSEGGMFGQELMSSVGNPNLDTTSSYVFQEQELGASRSPQVPGEPQDWPPASPEEAMKLPCYQLHSCLHQGVLPSYCCTTCHQLHASACTAGHVCRSQHLGQELRSEQQQRLWLQRTEVDMLLAD